MASGDDQWVVHPLPTLNEPEKAVCWLTPDDTLHENRVADLYLRSGLARIDNVFQKTRRLFNAVRAADRDAQAPTTRWCGMATRPTIRRHDGEWAFWSRYLTIFRAVNKFLFVFVGDDDAAFLLGALLGIAVQPTPAMRLGARFRPRRRLGSKISFGLGSRCRGRGGRGASEARYSCIAPMVGGRRRLLPEHPEYLTAA